MPYDAETGRSHPLIARLYRELYCLNFWASANEAAKGRDQGIGRISLLTIQNNVMKVDWRAATCFFVTNHIQTWQYGLAFYFILFFVM
jgi:hypothetical protein